VFQIEARYGSQSETNGGERVRFIAPNAASRQVLTAVLLVGLLAGCSGDGPRPEPGAQPLTEIEPGQLMRLAERFREAGDAGTALRFYTKAVEKTESDPAPLVGIGDLHRQVGEMARAQEAYNQALERAPGHGPARIGLARIALRKGEPETALEHLDGAEGAEQAAAAAERANIAGVALDLLGRHREARQAYARALAEAPEDRDVTANLALSLAVSGKHAAARDMLGELEKERASRAMARENLALVLAMQGKIDDAVRAAASALPEKTARSNRAFYQRLAQLEGGTLTRAVFLGKLPNSPDRQAGRETAPTPSEDSADQAAEPANAIRSPTSQRPARKPDSAPDRPGDGRGERKGADSPPAYYLQLASFSQREQLRAHWRNIAETPALAGMTPRVHSRTVEGRTKHHLLVGPIAGYSRARDRCDKLTQAQIACVVMPQEGESAPPALEAADAPEDGESG